MRTLLALFALACAISLAATPCVRAIAVRLGLFDDPWVEPDEAERTCASAQFRAAGDRAQRRAATVRSASP